MKDDLFPRVASLQVEDILITGLRLAFEIERSPDKTPNKSKINVYNLSADTRARLTKLPTARVVLTAGYPDNLGVLFKGDVRKPTGLRHAKNGTEWVTTFEAGDGESTLNSARFTGSFAPGTGLKDIVRALAKPLTAKGIGIGNLEEALNSGTFRQGQQSFSGGFAARGRAGDEMSRLLKSMGLEFSVQDERIQVLRPTETVKGKVLLLSSKLGTIIGSPVYNSAEKKQAPPTLKVSTPLQPELRPGVMLRVESEEIQAYFKVKKVTHSGDTHGGGGDWKSECTCLAV